MRVPHRSGDAGTGTPAAPAGVAVALADPVVVAPRGPTHDGPRTPWRATAAAATSVLLWAAAFVGIRAVGPALAPGALALGRLLIGSVALGAILLARREGLPPRKAVPGIAACGVLWFAAYNVLLNAGEHLVDAGTASMIVNIGPLFIALLAGLFLGEGFPRALVVGSVVAFTGTTIIAGAGRSSGEIPLRGLVLLLLAAVAYAGGVVMQKQVLRHAAALQVTWGACAIGALVCLPFAPSLVSGLRDAPSGAVIGWLLFLGLLPTAVGFTTWAYALGHMTAGQLGATTYLVPPLTVLMGWGALKEVPPVAALLGGAVCLTGVAIARRSRT